MENFKLVSLEKTCKLGRVILIVITIVIATFLSSTNIDGKNVINWNSVITLSTLFIWFAFAIIEIIKYEIYSLISKVYQKKEENHNK
jgi:hypothetical protein